MNIYNIDNKLLEELRKLRRISNFFYGTFIDVKDLRYWDLYKENFFIVLKYFSYFNIEVIQFFESFIILFPQSLDEHITIIEYENRKNVGDVWHKDCLRFINIDLWSYLNDIYKVKTTVKKRCINLIKRYKSYEIEIKILKKEGKIKKLTYHLDKYKTLTSLINSLNINTLVDIPSFIKEQYTTFTVFFYQEQKIKIYKHAYNCKIVDTIFNKTESSYKSFNESFNEKSFTNIDNEINLFPFYYQEKIKNIFTLDIREAIKDEKIILTNEIEMLKLKAPHIIFKNISNKTNSNKIDSNKKSTIIKYKGSMCESLVPELYITSFFDNIYNNNNYSFLPFIPFLLADTRFNYKYTQEDLNKVNYNDLLFNKKLTFLHSKIKLLLSLLIFKVNIKLSEIKFLVCLEKDNYSQTIKILPITRHDTFFNNDFEDEFNSFFKEFKLSELIQTLNEVPLSSTQYLFQLFNIEIPRNSLEYFQLSVNFSSP